MKRNSNSLGELKIAYPVFVSRPGGMILGLLVSIDAGVCYPPEGGPATITEEVRVLQLAQKVSGEDHYTPLTGKHRGEIVVERGEVMPALASVS